jgi:hypothetical protein
MPQVSQSPNPIIPARSFFKRRHPSDDGPPASDYHGNMPQDLVAYAGGDGFDFEAKVVAAISAQLGRTDEFVWQLSQSHPV